MARIPAAAVLKGDQVLWPTEGGTVQVLVHRVANSEPEPGMLTWYDSTGDSYPIHASAIVEVTLGTTRLPKERR